MKNIDSSSHFWLPFTQMKSISNVPSVKSGKGIMLELSDGRRLMDCISSWWVTLHGHAQPEIAEAIYRQAMTLEQVICAGLTHEPAEKLASALVSILPSGLKHVFYSDDGSTAVEVGLKMAVQYWKNMEKPGHKRFLAFEGAYHGDTMGAMSVSHRSIFTSAFNDLMFNVDFVPYPATWIGDDQAAEKEASALAVLDRLLETHPGEYAALIVEPLIQGAGGMRMCRPGFLKSLRERLRGQDILLIFDEVMVGFGRTGDLFASVKADVSPDIICLSKGITGGFMPLAATVCNDEVYGAFYADDPAKTLYHGHSYTANPIGCAAALASFDLLMQNQHRFRGMEAWHLRGISGLKDHPRLSHLRACGTIAAMDVIDGENSGYLSAVGPMMKSLFFEKGFLLRPLGNVLYILPPYCITEAQLQSVYECIIEVADRLHNFSAS